MVALAYCHKDAALAANLFRWMSELDGQLRGHRLVLIEPKGLAAEHSTLVRPAASVAFLEVQIIRPATTDESGWPASCNLMFRTAAAFAAKERQAFLWLEPDCVPLHPQWLDYISEEYVLVRKPYSGFIRTIPVHHLNGVAVYPPNLAALNPASVAIQPTKTPFDLRAPQKTLDHTHASRLFYHDWGTESHPPEFPDAKSLERIPKEAVLFHRCKSGSLIERLREKRAPVPEKPSLGSRLATIAARILSPVGDTPKVDLLYICVRSPSEPNVPRNFRESHERFVRTYKQFKPAIPHRLIVVCYNGERDTETEALFAGLNPVWMYYNGTGFDIGTYLTIGRTLDSDFVLCCGSNIHFHQHGWLERFVEAFRKHGEGAFASSASYEVSPHLRTGCIGTTPKLLRRYPHTVTTRAESYKFESGEWSFTRWIQSQGLPALMVMKDGELAQPDWRKPANIFRRGDQSNCIVWDRHTKVYFDSSPADQLAMAKMADGGREYPHVPLGQNDRTAYKTITIIAATSLNTEGHAKAIEWTASLIPHPCEKVLISPVEVAGFSGRQYRLPEPWAKNGTWGLDDVSDFLLHGLHEYVKTDVAITVHDDGYALNKSKWTDDFLKYDFIGAPWPAAFRWTKPDRRVGNGGFALRSRRWLERATQLPKLPKAASEDIYASITHAEHFLHADCRVAPLEVAMRWSFEYAIEEFPNWTLKDSFGWHGRKAEPVRKHLVLL